MVYCSALNCRNATSGVNKNSCVSFYGFPLANKPLLEQWVRNMGRDTGTPSKYQRLCSDHFQESSFEWDPLKPPWKRRLLSGAVPNKFILGENGEWLEGTPQNSTDIMKNKTQEWSQHPKHWMVSQKFPNGAEWPTLHDWQNEFYKAVLKEIYESLTTLGKDCPVPQSKIPAAWVKILQDLQGRKIPASLGAGNVVPGHAGATTTSQMQRGEATQLHGPTPGGFQNLPQNVSVKGGTSQIPTNQANPRGNVGGSSSPAGQLRPKESEVPWFICTHCGKSFARHLYLIRHQKIHWQVRPYKCMECGKSFLENCRLKYHMRTHAKKTPLPGVFLG